MTMSTAEMVPATITRTDPARYRERRDQIIWWLRATISPDEAEGMASSGYRPTLCGGCGRCARCQEEPAETVHGGGKRASADPTFVRAIVARLGQFPREVVARAHRALAALPPPDRLVLLLHDGAGLDQDVVARQLKISRSTVHRTRERALAEIVRRVWEGS